MTQVVADTALLRYLIEIDAVDVLPVLFRQVMTAPAVVQDLLHANTPTPVRTWIASPPPWLVMQAPRSPPLSSRRPWPAMQPAKREPRSLLSNHRRRKSWLLIYYLSPPPVSHL
jgi:hypothetical protein